MVLIVEDGSGLATAESYVSVVDADAYFTKFGGASATWAGLGEAGKEVELRKATRYLDAEYGGGSSSSFKGEKASFAQALEWPRVNAYTASGYLIPCTTSSAVPQSLKDAVAILAEKSADADLIPDIANAASIKIERVELGDLEVETEYENGSEVETYYRLAESIISDLIGSGWDMRRA